MNILVLLLNYVLHRTNKNAFCAKRKANEREYKMNWTRDTKANRQLKWPAHKIREKIIPHIQWRRSNNFI